MPPAFWKGRLECIFGVFKISGCWNRGEIGKTPGELIREETKGVTS